MAERFEIPTARLILVGAERSWLEAELKGPEALAAASGASVPASWPPEHHDRGVIEWVLSTLEPVSGGPWRFYYMVLGVPRTLIGTCGIKQAPDGNGCVEIGYSVVEQFQR